MKRKTKSSVRSKKQDKNKNMKNPNQIQTLIRGLLPIKTMEMMEAELGQDIYLGDQIHTGAAVLTINTKSFFEMMKGREPVFIKANEILDQLVPIVLQNEGVIDRFLGTGLSAFYTKGAGEALKAVIEIGERLETKEPYTIGLSYGMVMMGIVGNESVLSTAAISEYTGLSEFLQSIASSYYASVLVSESFAKQVKDFKNQYECRFLGYLYMDRMKKIEKIYDFYFIDEKEIRWLKQKTLLMFEEGVRLFAARNYLMARKHFVEVLRVNREDSAARKYLHLCESCIEKKADGDIFFTHY